MNTITLAFLEAQVARLNRATGSPEKPYAASGPMARGSGNQYVAQIGNYHLSGGYGGHSLHRMCNESGGVSDVFRCGHIAKRDLSERISAMLCGIEAAQTAREKREQQELVSSVAGVTDGMHPDDVDQMERDLGLA